LKTIFRIVRQKEYDRYLFIHEIGGHITGLNFHWDSGEEPMIEYKEPNKLLTEIYLDLSAIEDEYHRINTAMEIYFTTKNYFNPNEEKPVVTEPVDVKVGFIPKEQMLLVRTAIDFYLQSIENLDKEYASSRMYDIFDLSTTMAIFNYNISVNLTADEYDNFEIRHGYGLPKYF
jgi:hypothetical protein